ncbi:MAG: hypothetical protein NTZ05_22860 [Chloroflexi bacterium]|nr:hypothetical protein [Chloroflexota bacterium]
MRRLGQGWARRWSAAASVIFAVALAAALWLPLARERPADAERY